MRSTVIRIGSFSLGVLLLVCSMASPASAALTVAAPEIDGGTLATGLAGLSAGVLILRARFRSK